LQHASGFGGKSLLIDGAVNEKDCNSKQRGFLLLESAAAIFLISLLMVSFSEIFFECTLSILRSKEKAYAFNMAQAYAETIVNIDEVELFEKYYNCEFKEDEFNVRTCIDVLTEREYDNHKSKGTLGITVLVSKNGAPLAEIKTFRKAGWKNEE